VLLALLFLALGLAFYTLWPFRNPLIMAAVLATLCHPVQRFVTRRLPGRPNVGAALVLLGIVLLIILPLTTLISLLSAQGVRAFNDVSAWVGQVDPTNLPGNPRIAALSRWVDDQLASLTWVEQTLGINIIGIQDLRGQLITLLRNFGQFLYQTGLGLLGNLALLVLYSLLIGRGLMIAAAAPTLFTRLLAGAITLIFFTYAFVNMGMVSGILPVVGVPLPFISYGGSAMLVNMSLIGLVLNVSMRRYLFKQA